MAVGLLLLLLWGNSGTASMCDARQNGAQCYGVLGGSLHLQLMSSTSSVRWIRFRKDPNGDDIELLDMRNGIVQVLGPIQDRAAFHLTNITLIINNLTKRDSADYVFNAFQRLRYTDNMVHLTIIAPVSSPQLSSECLSTGEMRLSCSSEGEGVRYSWTLDGQTLGVDNHTLTLQGGQSARVSCSVQNQVSGARVTEDIFTCHGMAVFVVVWVMEVMALGAMWLAFLYLYRRKQCSQTSDLKDLSTT